MFCKKCGNELKDGTKFCPKCGTAVDQIPKEEEKKLCTGCGAELKPGAKFCPKCGTPVADNPQTEVNEPIPVEDKPAPVAELPPKDEEAKHEPVDDDPLGEKHGGVIALIISLVAIIVILIIGIIVYMFMSGKINLFSSSDTTTESGSGTDEEGSGSIADGDGIYTVNVYGTNPDTEATDANGVLTNATVKVYAIDAADEDEPLATITYDEKEKQKKKKRKKKDSEIDDVAPPEMGYYIRGIESGDIKIVVSTEGYIDYTGQITIEDGGETDVYMSKLPEAGTIFFVAEWNGNQDIDLCVFDSGKHKYFSIGTPATENEPYIAFDNGSDKGYEVAYIPLATENVSKNIYVVDSAAAKADTTSEFEANGITVTAYDSTGEILRVTADTSQNAPIWNVGYVYGGKVFTDSAEYLGDCTEENIWAQYLKEGQTARLKEKIEYYNTPGNMIKVFNPSIEYFEPAQRSDSKKWDKTVFYALEEHLASSEYFDKNVCVLKKLQVQSGITGNIIDYDIYLNPNTMLPNKIVSIEYLEDYLEIFEFYYDNNGKINFVFLYTTDNYISSYATVDKIGQRFLFCDDSLVTWRIIKSSRNIVNYCYGSAEEARLKDSSWKKTIKNYNSLKSSTKAEYDAVEKMMINYAYSTYYMATTTDSTGKIVGNVYDSMYYGYTNATIELYDDSFEKLLYTTRSDSNGQYCIYVPNEEYKYNIKIKGNTVTDECLIYDIDMTIGTLNMFVDSAVFFNGNTSQQLVRLYIGNAFYGYGSSIEDAIVYIRNGINNRIGEIVSQVNTNRDGYVEVYLNAGVYTIEVNKVGYESIFYTIISNPNEQNWYEYYTPPTLSPGEYAIVLSWGEEPSDLDSHLFTTTNYGVEHVWYADKNDNLSSYLDVDDTTSYGPETVTIRNFDSNKYYKYCVVDYTNSSNGYYGSYDMSYSNATVKVYSAGGHVATYHVPVNRRGVVWEVFEIRNGMITPIQRYYDNMNDYSWWGH